MQSGLRDKEWFADDRFWVDTYPFMFPEGSFEIGRQQASQLVRLLGLSEGRLLDLACGPGRHAVPIAQLPLSVVGVDLSTYLLAKARTYAEEAGARVSFLNQDIRAPLAQDGFDGAICMFNSFGLFDADADNRLVLKKVYASLRPGATFLLEVAGKEAVASQFSPMTARSFGEAGTVVQRQEVIDSWSRIRTEWTMIVGDAVTRAEYASWLFSGRELSEHLRAAGFKNVVLYGDLKGAPYAPPARSLIAKSTK